MIASVSLYIFIPIMVTLVKLEGYSSIRNMKLKVVGQVLILLSSNLNKLHIWTHIIQSKLNIFTGDISLEVHDDYQFFVSKPVLVNLSPIFKDTGEFEDNENIFSCFECESVQHFLYISNL